MTIENREFGYGMMPQDMLSQMRFFTKLKPSNWKCHLFGAENFTFTPNEGEVPNWFWRKMQYLAFGNRWEKIDPNI